MTSAQFLFCLTCLFLDKMAHLTTLESDQSIYQESDFLSVTTGTNLTLRCFYKTNVATRFYWYKQTLGQNPRLISSFYKYDSKGTFHYQFKNSPRFTLDTDSGKNHLTIRDLYISDSATYYCACSKSHKFEFAQGVTVDVKDSSSNIPMLVHQSASGNSVTLNCSVHTGTCDGQHSVYWFRNDGESHPGIIYTHGDRNDQCERKPDAQTHTCIYNLPNENLTIFGVETYYCTIASCGHVLFRERTKPNEDRVHSPDPVYYLSWALASTIILSVLLTFLLCTISKRNSCHCTDSDSRFSDASTTNAEYQSQQNEEDIHYAAFQQHRTNRSRGQRNNTETECVYSSLKE